MLPRARILSALSLSMAVAMAWPSGVPFGVMPVRGSRIETRVASHGSPGLTISTADWPGSLDSGRWDLVSDDFEEPDDRDLGRFLLLAVLPDGRDLPSLVPSSVEPTPAGPAPVYSPFPRSRLLRC